MPRGRASSSKRRKSTGKSELPSLGQLERMLAGPDGAPESAADRAMELVYQAWDASSPAKRVALARRALEIDPTCVDARLLLAHQARTPEQVVAALEEVVDLAASALGTSVFSHSRGEFWAVHETRPFMRAKLDLAQALWSFGDRALAVRHAWELIELNESDNQGVRLLLVTWLLHMRDVAGARALFERFPEDGLAHTRWSCALAAFMEGGSGERAEQLVRAAADENPHVVSLLLGREPLPDSSPMYMGIGDRDEAVAYVQQSLALWCEVDGALRWLAGLWPVGSIRGQAGQPG